MAGGVQAAVAVHIIGETPLSSEPAKIELPKAKLELTPPEDAPAASYRYDEAKIGELLQHEDDLIRGFATEQARLRRLDAQLLVDRLKDGDDFIFGQALEAVVDRQIEEATKPLEDLFLSGPAERAHQIATALGQLSPSSLLRISEEKGSLDDVTYSAVIGAAAVSSNAQALRLIERGLTRILLMSPERGHALCRAALISESEKAIKTVISAAVGESNGEAPEGKSYPNRAAVAAVAGLAPIDSRWEVGNAVLEHALNGLKKTAEQLSQPKALLDAIEAKNAGDILRALEPLAFAELRPGVEEDPALRTTPKRRQALLRVLVGRARDFENLEPAAAGVFVAAAEVAVGIVAAGALAEETSGAMKLVSKALEADPETLSQSSVEELAQLLSKKTPREMRRISSILVNEQFRSGSTFAHFAEASFRAGYGSLLISAASELQSEGLHHLLCEAAFEAVEDAESALLEIFDEETLEEKAAKLALLLAEHLRTERLGLAVAHRFYELRTIDKSLTARIIAYSALHEALPLLESRAYTREPEEAAWAVLALASSQPIEGKLAETVDNIRARRNKNTLAPLELELRCTTCGEKGFYGFLKAYFDPKPEENGPDPAYVGDTRCKACGTADTLALTEAGERIMHSHMLRQIEDGEAGRPIVAIVGPGSYDGKDGNKVGIARALREINARIEQTPAAIQPRLERARLRVLLHRVGVAEDLAAIRAEDPESVEALVVESTMLRQQEDYEKAAACLSQAWHALRSDAPRLYDSESASSLTQTVEDLLLDVADHGPIPAEIDLTSAKQRRSAHDTSAPKSRPPSKRRGFARRGG